MSKSGGGQLAAVCAMYIILAAPLRPQEDHRAKGEEEADGAAQVSRRTGRMRLQDPMKSFDCFLLYMRLAACPADDARIPANTSTGVIR